MACASGTGVDSGCTADGGEAFGCWLAWVVASDASADTDLATTFSFALDRENELNHDLLFTGETEMESPSRGGDVRPSLDEDDTGQSETEGGTVRMVIGALCEGIGPVITAGDWFDASGAALSDSDVVVPFTSGAEAVHVPSSAA